MTDNLPRIAVVYDHLLTRYGGAEMVLSALMKAFPEAQLHTVVYDKHAAQWVDERRVHSVCNINLTPWLRIREVLDMCLPFLIEKIDLTNYDVIISVTSSYAKGVLTRPDQLHISYILNTTRYLYEARESLAATHLLFRLWGIRSVAKLVRSYLHLWDMQAAFRPDYIVTLSQLVKKRIEETYGRAVDALLTPPVSATTKPAVATKKSGYIVCISRLVEYKRIDLALSACLELDQPIIIAGTGRSQAALQKIAGNKAYIRQDSESLTDCLKYAQAKNAVCIFWGECTDTEKAQLYSGARASLSPGVEDFGISALEALFYGTPIILSQESGAAENITDMTHGVFIHTQSKSAIIEAIKQMQNTSFDSKILRKKAAEYGEDVFIRKVHNIVSQFYKKHVTMGG